MSRPVRVPRGWTALRAARYRALLTQAELAEELHVSRRTVYSLETGRSVPSLPLALALSRRLGLPVDELFEL